MRQHLLPLIAAIALTALLAVGVYLLNRGVHSAGVPVATPTSCHSDGVLPDSSCTPGAIDPRVTQDNIHSTICMNGYTATVRPPVSYTDALKVQQIKEYAYPDTRPADYEEDHLIPLELGGNPTDPRNLWPQPKSSATVKDGTENTLRERVCGGNMTLASAQTAIATDWQAAGR